MRRLSLVAVAVLGLVAGGCFPPPPAPPRVQRVGADTQIDLSGKWNDTDANLVAKEMIRQCLGRPWSAQFKQKTGKNPVVKLYPIRNRSSEHINYMFFTKQVEAELVNSGVVDVVAGWNETGAARFERRDQGRHASDLTKKENQQELGADFVLNGWIVTENDRAGGQEVRAYVVTMEVVNVQSQRKAWMHSHRLKKVINRPASSW